MIFFYELDRMKILIVQIGHIGDMVLTMPMVMAIKMKYPSAHVHILASHRNYHLAESHPMIDKVLIYRKQIVAVAGLIRDIRCEDYDWWIDPKDHPSREGRLLCRLSGISSSIGYNAPKTHIFTYSVPSAEVNNGTLPYPMHCIERNMQALFPLDIQVSEAPLRPMLPVNAQSADYVRQVLSSDTSATMVRQESPLVVCNLSAGSAHRYWRQEYWVQTVQRLLTEYSCRVVLLSMPQDRHLAEEIRLVIPQAFVFPSRSIDDVVALVAIADLVISPDTSVVHIAAAFDVPCIALYHSLWWNMHKFEPRSSRSWLVHSIAPSDAIQDVPLEQVMQCVDQWSVQ